MLYQPLVSIITIVYNGEKYLEQAMLSVFNQTYPNIEYIVIDGGSSDNSVSIIKKNETKISFWLSEPDKGISDAFNKGITRAKGEIIGLINSDDWYEPYAVARVVGAFNSSNADIVYGDLRYWKDGIMDFIAVGNHKLLLNEMSINHPTVFIKSKVYETNGPFDNSLKYAMDYELLLRFKMAGFNFFHIPEVLANMRWEGESDKQWYLACKELLLIKNKYLKDQKLLNNLYFLKQVAAIKIGRVLQMVGLKNLVKFYRSKFSTLKKRYI